MDWLADPNAWLGLLTLTVLEIVLGIDNIIFISILASKLPAAQQPKARRLGLMGAFVTRLALLFSIAWVIRLTAPLFSIWGAEISGRDLILIAGGLFLIAKATWEIHGKLEGEDTHGSGGKALATMGAVVLQIMVVDLVFSLDSVITAVGMADDVPVMVLAVVIAVGVMMISAGAIATFINRHPTIKMLALSFLLLIGVMLVAEGFDQHVPKGYVYSAMAFSLFVEMLNLRARRHDPTPPGSVVPQP